MYLRGLKKENEVSNLKREKERCQVNKQNYYLLLSYFSSLFLFNIVFFRGKKTICNNFS